LSGEGQMSFIRRWRLQLYGHLACRGDLWLQSPLAIVWCCLCDPVFRRFSRTPTCDRRKTARQTGRQTQAHSKYRSVKTTRILITSLTYPKLVYIQKQNFKRIQLTDSRHCVSAGQIDIYQSSDVVIGHLFHMQ